MTRVFISYSHDSDSHREFVADLSAQLRQAGLDCYIDQYVNGFPPEGWQRWMESQIEQADFILLVCTSNYLKRYQGRESANGKGVNFEGIVLSQHLYDSYYYNTKFIPVIPEQGSYDNVPMALKAYNVYSLPSQFDDLYRYLTAQPKLTAPSIGPKQILPVHKGKIGPPLASKTLNNTFGLGVASMEYEGKPEEKPLQFTKLKNIFIIKGNFKCLVALLFFGIVQVSLVINERFPITSVELPGNEFFNYAILFLLLTIGSPIVFVFGLSKDFSFFGMVILFVSAINTLILYFLLKNIYSKFFG